MKIQKNFIPKSTESNPSVSLLHNHIIAILQRLCLSSVLYKYNTTSLSLSLPVRTTSSSSFHLQMSDSNRRSTNTTTTTSSSSSWHFPVVLLTIVLPVAVAAVVFRLEPFEPAEFPAEELGGRIVTVPASNGKMRRGWESVGKGELEGPEDVVYDGEEGVIYTGCSDGWIKRVTVNDSVVQRWVNTGGRPLGIALARNGQLIVADSDKGLLRVTREGEVQVLADEVDGLKFKLTDGVDVAEDGTIYFTDASYKYNMNGVVFDALEGKPHGRFMSYHPSTNHTILLASNLYFPNGVAVSPDQHFVLFCETFLRKCRKYYIKGPKKGSIEAFIADLPGMPDNIHYDGEGQYWIGLTTSSTYSWDLAQRYPFIRKAIAIITKYVGKLNIEKNGGVVVVDLEGKPIAHYYDPHLSYITSGIKIGNHLYCGTIRFPFIIRLDLKKYPALPTT